jgi:hypothetical protein
MPQPDTGDVRDIIYGLRDVMTLRYFEYPGLGYENMGLVFRGHRGPCTHAVPTWS